MNDDQLRRLLSDAVSDIEPEDRIEELRASVHPSAKVVPMSRSRSWYAAAGIVATAAVIGVVAYVTSVVEQPEADTSALPTDPGIRHSSATATDTAGASGPSPTQGSATPAATDDAGPVSKAVAVYYVGTDPRGRPVLFREFHRAPDYPANAEGSDRDLLDVAVRDAMTTPPLDPDYDAPWIGTAALDHASYDTTGNGYTLQIALKDGAPAQRPAGMSPAEARAAVQAARLHRPRRDRETRPGHVHHRPPRPSCASDPARHRHRRPDHGRACAARRSRWSASPTRNEGAIVSGRLTVTGVNNGFEGTVAVYLEQNGHRLPRPSRPSAGPPAIGSTPGRSPSTCLEVTPGHLHAGGAATTTRPAGARPRSTPASSDVR